MSVCRPLVAQSIIPLHTFHSNERNPFHLKGTGEALKITLDSESLDDLDESDTCGLAAIGNLAEHESIDVVQTKPGMYPHFDWGERRHGLDFLPFVIERENSTTNSAILNYDNILEVYRHSPFLQMQLDIAAHRTGRRHIFVTTEFVPFEDKSKELARCGALRPKQAALVLGLFLKSRNDNSLIIPSSKSRYCEEPTSYYLTLGRARLRGIESFLQRCMLLQGKDRDPVRRLAWSMVEKTARACQARDYVLRAHLSGDSNMNIAYHFDYLTICLVGVWDSLAEISRRLYSIPRENGRQVGFRQKWFRKALRDNGGINVIEATQTNITAAFINLLHSLRNTIHGPAYVTISHDHELQFAVPSEILERVDNSLAQLGGGADFGFVGPNHSSFQPAQTAERILELNCDTIANVASAVEFHQVEIDKSKLRQFGQDEFDVRRIKQVQGLG